MVLHLAWVASLLLGALHQAGEGPGPIAITHANVVDVRDGATRADMTVVVEGGKIVAVGPATGVEVPAGATVVEGAGRYLIPGLWDMHVHCVDRSALALFVANGVTGVRVMWGNPTFGSPLMPKIHSAMRREVAEGTRIGPRMVVASTIMDGPEPVWPGALALGDEADARKAVVEAQAGGADFIKVYSKLPRGVFLAIAAESKARGIPFVGHVPADISAAEASDAGMRSMEHLYGLFLACSSREEAILKARGEYTRTHKGLPSLGDLARSQLSAAEGYDEAKAAAFFARLRRNGTWQCPTLTVLRALANLDDPGLADDPRLKYIPAMIRTLWDPETDPHLRAMTAEDFALQRRVFARDLELVGRLYRAGVPILAGTDELNPYCFPGFSLHDELALLVQAGLAPIDALRAATLNPARYLGEEETAGTIEPGHEADLVLLDADPLADIRNTTKVRAVVLRGRLLDREALDALLADAEAASGKAIFSLDLLKGLLPAASNPGH